MFPLKQRKLIRGCDAHIKAGLGCGGDWVASKGTELFAPFNGTIQTYYGNQGGQWLRLTRTNGDKVEMAHLDRYVIMSGNVTAGQLIAYTGNTGSVTTGPHLHIQIFRDEKRIDPDRYNWEESVIIPPMDYKKLWEEEKAGRAEDIKEKLLNYDKWQSELDRANGLEKKLEKEVTGHKETIVQLEGSRKEVQMLEAEMKVAIDKIINARLALE